WLVVTLLGAEAQPLRGWQQGAALLDWGFSAPVNASVGRLVEPGETERKPDLPALPARGGQPAGGVAHTHARTAASGPARSRAAVGGVTGAVVAVPVLVLVLVAARRRRVGRVLRTAAAAASGGSPRRPED